MSGTSPLSSPRALWALGILSDLDVELAESLAELAGEQAVEPRLGAAFASWAVQRGHVCAELGRLGERRWLDADGQPLEGVQLPTAESWKAALAESPLFVSGSELRNAASADAGSGSRHPFVVDADRVYLRRYFDYEQRLGHAIRERAGRVGDAIDGALLTRGLDRLFPSGEPGAELQRVAASLAVLQRFAVISGGPGTGKTYTVAKVLLLLQEQRAHAGLPPYRVELLAPTGKAAQRLGESIRQNLESLADDEPIPAGIPTAASTIHRALGYQARTPTRFRHDALNPLPKDVVVVDEASMVDLALMAKLVSAVRAEARLILLGDKDQLASVEAGAILGDIYGGRAVEGYSERFAGEVRDLTGDELPVAASDAGAMGDCRVHLEHNYRSKDHPGISALARAVNAGDPEAARSVLAKHAGEVELLPFEALEPTLGPLLLDKYAALGSGSANDKLELLNRFRVLCVHRKGPLGVEAVNAFAEAHLRRHGRLQARTDWYAGRPVIVTANDYQVGLFNGDVGVLGPSEAAPGENASDLGDAAPIVAHFPSDLPDGLREISPGRLPPHETVFAMSVHKSQGSELDEVALILPTRPSPILTRELVYTAITRARRRVRIFGTAEIFDQAIATHVQRASGLRAMLWGK